MKVEVDRGRCIAVGNCAALAPEVFDQSDDDGTVLVLRSTVPAAERERARDAALRCPAAAIVLHESSTSHDE